MMLRDLSLKQIAEEGASVRLISLPGVADIERIMSTSEGWKPENDNLQERIDAVSVSLFGVTEADARKPEPDVRDYLDREGAELFDRGVHVYPEGRELERFDADCVKWQEWQEHFVIFEYVEPTHDEIVDGIREFGVDVSGDDLKTPLRCWERFMAQIIVTADELLPEARFTYDGSGKAAPKTAETWGRGVAEDARKFIADRVRRK